MICGWAEKVSAPPLVLYIPSSFLHKRTSKATGCSTSPCRPVCLGMDSHIRNTCRLSCLLSKCMCNDAQITTLRDCYFWLEPTGICKHGWLQVAVSYRWLKPTGTCGHTWLQHTLARLKAICIPGTWLMLFSNGYSWSQSSLPLCLGFSPDKDGIPSVAASNNEGKSSCNTGCYPHWLTACPPIRV